MFGRRDPKKFLRLIAQECRQGEVLRVTQKRRWDADPTARSMVVRRRDFGELAVQPMRWGLVPDWAEGEDRDRPLVNIRAEGLVGDADWRRMLNTRRCIVPVEQFFEWKRIGDVKTREYALRYKTRRPLMIAGLWTRSSGSGGTVDGFAYISCPANRLVGLIRDRMPVILDEAGVAAWFNPDASLESLIGLLKPCRWDELELHPVGQPSQKAKPYQPSLFATRAA